MPTIYKVKFEKTIDISEKEANVIYELSDGVDSIDSPEIFISSSTFDDEECKEELESCFESKTLKVIKDLSKSGQTFIISEW